MKYPLIFFAMWIATVWLIIERLFKCLLSLLIFLWEFKIIKEQHGFWKKIHYPDLNQPDKYAPFVLSCNDAKTYYANVLDEFSKLK